MSFQEKIKPMTLSIRNLLDRIDMHSVGEPDYDTISDLVDLIDSGLDDIQELIDEEKEVKT